MIVASSHHYSAHASTLKPLLSVLLAILLWPLLLLGVNVHIKYSLWTVRSGSAY
ncbi:MAG: hypothetical protein ACXVII_46155 [Solirubrobacteraceae bacterium]